MGNGSEHLGKSAIEITNNCSGNHSLAFPPGFIWGVASSSHQMEGGNTNNQWYEWERRGKILTGDSALIACDWWNNAEEDFAHAHNLGVRSIRLSLEWSRIETGKGIWSSAAFLRYRQMLSNLRELGIRPLVTLHHFTHPLWFEQIGGFENADSIALFERYASKCVDALGDLCDFWCTINEPSIYAGHGYILGRFPPGRRHDIFSYYRVQANMLRAHAAAYRAIHKLQPKALVGLAHQIHSFVSANPHNPFDRLATSLYDSVINGLVLDTLEKGRSSSVLRPIIGDLQSVKGTTDYIGINQYFKSQVSFKVKNPRMLFTGYTMSPDATPMDPGVDGLFGGMSSQGLYDALRRVATYRLPIYITEHGMADASDSKRPIVLVAALNAVHKAITDGIPVRGYYHWSLLDNFEWADGWSAHFGLIALDATTQVRKYRASAYVYREICRTNTVPVYESIR